jgi:hypothetical protein
MRAGLAAKSQDPRRKIFDVDADTVTAERLAVETTETNRPNRLTMVRIEW